MGETFDSDERDIPADQRLQMDLRAAEEQQAMEAEAHERDLAEDAARPERFHGRTRGCPLSSCL